MDLQQLFNIILVMFTVSNLAAMGLELNLRDSLKTLRSARSIGLILLLGWVVGPALAFLIIWLMPLQEGHTAGLLLVSLAPTAPLYPLVVNKEKADMSFAAVFMLLTALGTVVLLPFLAPLLIKGLVVDSWSLAKPLLIMVLLPLLIGGFIRILSPPVIANIFFPVVKKIGRLSLLIALILTLILYGRDMLSTIGSFAPGAKILLFIVITTLSYYIHFCLKQKERISMALSMCTRILPLFSPLSLALRTHLRVYS